jgi:hypothetical protein
MCAFRRFPHIQLPYIAEAGIQSVTPITPLSKGAEAVVLQFKQKLGVIEGRGDAGGIDRLDASRISRLAKCCKSRVIGM